MVDLEDLCGACERCGTAIRYEHHCWHPMGAQAVVGCICCGDITGDYLKARDRERELKNLALRRAKYLCSPRWYETLKGNLSIQYHGARITVFADGDQFRAVADGTFSRRSYSTVEAAKIAAFNFLFKHQ